MRKYLRDVDLKQANGIGADRHCGRLGQGELSGPISLPYNSMILTFFVHLT